jgi:hypothetical protein
MGVFVKNAIFGIFQIIWNRLFKSYRKSVLGPDILESVILDAENLESLILSRGQSVGVPEILE